MTAKDLREKIGNLLQGCRDLNDAATKENRSLNDEEGAEYDKGWADYVRAKSELERMENLAEEDRTIAENAAKLADAAGDVGGNGGTDARDLAAVCFRNFLGTGRIEGEGLDEFRALQAGVDTTGGYLVAPELFVAQLIQAVDNEVFVRKHATVLPPMTTSAKIGVPTLDTDVADPDWTTEILTGSEDSSLAFGKREMEPHPLAKLIKVSNQLLRTAAIGAEQLVRDRLTYKLGTVLENNYLNGTGAAQPLGVFTASADGISTGRDASDGNDSGSIKFDGLIEAKYTLKGAYWAKARWNFHRDGMKQISKLKDTEGQYIWRQSVREGEPDTILGHPVDVSEYTPSTFTTGLYVGIFGDWSKYWILDSLAMQIQRLDELYAATNQVGFITRYEGDGAPVLEEAFVRVKLG